MIDLAFYHEHTLCFMINHFSNYIIFYSIINKVNGQILIIDDSSSLRQMVKFILSEKGFDVYEAIDGAHGLAMLKELNSCGLIITDINMPQMNGIELISELKDSSDYFEIPVIVLTSESDELIKKQAVEVGATAWLEKPFQPNSLINIVERFYKKK